MDTKNQIIQASLELFSTNSYHGASIRDIAKSIGKRESSIYNHFSSKEEILISLVNEFGQRNFGSIILTDKLINIISKPEKFFITLAENIIEFWNTQNERMFIKVLLNLTSIELEQGYSVHTYLHDFKSLCEFIFQEMMKHKFIRKFDVKVLSQEFISPLFLFEIELLNKGKSTKEVKSFIKNHVDFIWKVIKK